MEEVSLSFELVIKTKISQIMYNDSYTSDNGDDGDSEVMFCISFQTLFSQAFDLEARDYLNEDDQTVVKHRSW